MDIAGDRGVAMSTQPSTLSRPPARSPAPACWALLCLLTLAACAGAPEGNGIRATGEVGGRPFSAELDAEIARYYVEDFPEAHPENWHEALARLERQLGPGVPETQRLAKIARRHDSTDLAALLFIDAVYRHPRNRRFAACMRRMENNRHTPGSDAREALAAVRERFIVVLAPGWLYRDQATTEADFERTRGVLDAAGIEHVFVATRQDGTVEANARTLAERIAALDPGARRIVLVSASKSGAEVHLAMGRLLEAADRDKVAAWINVGGLLHGTPLADHWTGFPHNLAARALMAWQGWSWASLRSLRTQPGRARLAAAELPRDLLVINYIGVPMGSQLTHGAHARYRRLAAEYGPNDGATPLAHAAVEGGITVTEPGVDHYFLRTDIGRRTLAMTAAIQRHLAGRACP